MGNMRSIERHSNVVVLRSPEKAGQAWCLQDLLSLGVGITGDEGFRIREVLGQRAAGLGCQHTVPGGGPTGTSFRDAIAFKVLTNSWSSLLPKDFLGRAELSEPTVHVDLVVQRTEGIPLWAMSGGSEDPNWPPASSLQQTQGSLTWFNTPGSTSVLPR